MGFFRKGETCNLRGGLWFVGVVVDAKDLYPLAIVEVSLSICKRALEELVDLRDGEMRWGRERWRHLLLVHAFADVCQPPAHFVDLYESGVGVVETLKGVVEICLWVELKETFAHHCEEHGKVDAGICGVCSGCTGTCGEEVVEHGVGRGDAFEWQVRKGEVE